MTQYLPVIPVVQLEIYLPGQVNTLNETFKLRILEKSRTVAGKLFKSEQRGFQSTRLLRTDNLLTCPRVDYWHCMDWGRRFHTSGRAIENARLINFVLCPLYDEARWAEGKGRMGGWVDLGDWCYIPRWFTCQQTVTHPNSNRSQADMLHHTNHLLCYCVTAKLTNKSHKKCSCKEKCQHKMAMQN